MSYPLLQAETEKDVRSTVAALKDTHYLGGSCFQRFSSWDRLVRAISLLEHILGFRAADNGYCRGWHRCDTYRNVDALLEAELYIIK